MAVLVDTTVVDADMTQRVHLFTLITRETLWNDLTMFTVSSFHRRTMSKTGFC